MVLMKLPKQNNKNVNLVVCDNEGCEVQWQQRHANTLQHNKKYGKHICPMCMTETKKQESSVRLKATKAKMTPEQRSAASSKAGKASQKTGKPSKTWFTRARWDNLPREEQEQRIHKASKASQNKLKSMTDDQLAEHYAKIMRGGLGFVSKGSVELFNCLKDSMKHDVQKEYQISRCCVDICIPSLNIVVEYNGDAYHCNPRMFEPQHYSTLIKMTAEEKWENDRKRYGFLRGAGFVVLVVWESDWKACPEQQIERIMYVVKAREKEIYSKTEML